MFSNSDIRPDGDYSAGEWWKTARGISDLTQDDRKRIRAGFDCFKKARLKNGARFFTTFFGNNPSYRSLFAALKDVPIEEIARHKFILNVHIDRFFVIFEEFIENVYNFEGLHNSVYGMLNSKSHIESGIAPIHCRVCACDSKKTILMF